MKRTIVIATLLLGIVACGDDNAPADAPTVASEPAAEAPSAPAWVNDMLEEPLPEGVELDLPVELRRDRIHTDDNGNPWRQVVLDLHEGEVGPTIALVQEALVDAGFESGKIRDLREGGAKVKFTKDDYGIAIATVRPDWGKAPATASGYIIVLEWRPDPAANQ